MNNNYKKSLKQATILKFARSALVWQEHISLKAANALEHIQLSAAGTFQQAKLQPKPLPLVRTHILIEHSLS